MKYAIYTFIVLVAAIIGLECCEMSRFKDFGYDDAKHAFAWGDINTRIVGADKKVDEDNSVREAPYDLHVWFALKLQAPPQTSCHAAIESVSLIAANTKEVVFSKSGIKADFESSSEKDIYKAFFSFKWLNFNYVDYDLDITFSLESCNQVKVSEQLVLPVKKNYREKRITILNQ